LLDVSISVKVLDASLFVLLLTWRLSTVEVDFVVGTLFADAADTLFIQTQTLLSRLTRSVRSTLCFRAYLT